MVYALITAVFILFSGAFPASATPQSVNEDEVRSLTEKFGQTIAAGDLDKKLWSIEDLVALLDK